MPENQTTRKVTLNRNNLQVKLCQGIFSADLLAIFGDSYYINYWGFLSCFGYNYKPMMHETGHMCLKLCWSVIIILIDSQCSSYTMKCSIFQPHARYFRLGSNFCYGVFHHALASSCCIIHQTPYNYCSVYSTFMMCVCCIQTLKTNKF